VSSDSVTMNNAVYTRECRPFGFTYGQWTVKWWQWFLSTPRSADSLMDESSTSAYHKQTPYTLWFLAGKISDKLKYIPRHHCRIPSSDSILFPVINSEFNPLEYPDLTMNDLRKRVEADENRITLKECLLDGVHIPVLRVNSDPEIFDVTVNKENPFGIEGGGTTTVVADGYWVFLKPLESGIHHVTFRGSCENGSLNAGADYIIHIE
jgi:hypothetical protein